MAVKIEVKMTTLMLIHPGCDHLVKMERLACETNPLALKLT